MSTERDNPAIDPVDGTALGKYKGRVRCHLLITVVSVDLCESQCEIYSVQRRSALITVSRFDHYEKLPKIAPFR